MRKRKKKYFRKKPPMVVKGKKIKKVWSYSAITKAVVNKDIAFDPIISNKVFDRIVDQQLKTAGLETAGFGLYDEETNRITWNHWSSSEVASAATVETSSMEATTACIVTNGVAPNMQYHTQPNMGVGPSGQDLKDQDNVLSGAMRAEKKGLRVFLIIDELTWGARLFKWEGDKLERFDGHCIRESGTKLKTGYAHTFVGGWTDGYGVDPYYGGWWINDTRDKDVEVMPLTLPAETGLYDPQASFRGDWSHINSDYDELFRIFGVAKYQWSKLWSTVGVWFPGAYYEIVDNPSTWKNVEQEILLKAEDIIAKGDEI